MILSQIAPNVLFLFYVLLLAYLKAASINTKFQKSGFIAAQSNSSSSSLIVI
jgi:hypothetical protein